MDLDKTYLNWQKKITNNSWFRRFWVFWGIYAVLLVFAAGGVLVATFHIQPVILALLAFVLGRLVISPLIYLIYKKQRPYQRLGFNTIYSQLSSHKTNRPNAFPSDHAVSFAAISAVFYFFNPILGIVFLGITVLNGIARVILGYHDIYDIFAGWLIGFASAFLVIFCLYYVGRF